VSDEDAQIIVVLAIATVIASYARVLFSKFKNFSIARGLPLGTCTRATSEWLARLPSRSARRPLTERKKSTNITYVSFWPHHRSSSISTRKRYHTAVWGVVSMVPVLGLVMVLAICFAPPNHVETPNDTFVTEANEWRSGKLEDGSVVFLGPSTTLLVSFTDHRRDVHLVKGGTMFDVKTDTKRPFVVNTYGTAIMAAVDSKFVVTVDGAVDLEVYEGMVKVSLRGAKEGATGRMLRAGESFRVPVDRGRSPNRSNVLASAIRLSQPIGS
jgi:ferric-dicitrate binding protein FerR (iron transport regulator)